MSFRSLTNYRKKEVWITNLVIVMTTILLKFFLFNINFEKYTRITFSYNIFYICKIYRILKTNNYIINKIFKF